MRGSRPKRQWRVMPRPRHFTHPILCVAFAAPPLWALRRWQRGRPLTRGRQCRLLWSKGGRQCRRPSRRSGQCRLVRGPSPPPPSLPPLPPLLLPPPHYFPTLTCCLPPPLLVALSVCSPYFLALAALTITFHSTPSTPSTPIRSGPSGSGQGGPGAIGSGRG